MNQYKIVLGLVLGIIGASAIPSDSWTHPGILNNRAELELMKDKVAAGGDTPWTRGYNAIPSYLSYVPNAPGSMDIEQCDGCQADADPLFNDGLAAYGLALRWVITGDIRYANRAILILNDWADTLTGVSGAQADLNIAWYSGVMANAAEILKHWGGSGWSAGDITAFDTMVRNALINIDDGIGAGATIQHIACPSYSKTCHNWASMGAYARMAWGVYLEHQALYDSGLNGARAIIGNYIRKCGHDVFNGYTIETCRTGNTVNCSLVGGDVGHAMMGVSGLAMSAEISKKQGTADLFGYVNPSGFGIRDALVGHAPFIYFNYSSSTRRPGSSIATWPCDMTYPGYNGNNFTTVPIIYGDWPWHLYYNHYRHPDFLSIANFRTPAQQFSNRSMLAQWDDLTHNYHGLVDEGPGPGPGPTPTTPQTWHATTTGTDPACTAAAPCSITQVMTKHIGGDTIKLGPGIYAFECHGCLKSGTAGQPTILESATHAGSTIAVGTHGTLVNPGMATLSGTTGITLWIKPAQQHITVRGVNCTTTGSGTNPCIQVSDTTASSANAAEDILFENMEVQAPTRVGAEAALRIRGDNGSARVTIKTSRIHRAGAAVTFGSTSAITDGIQLSGPGHVIEDSDIYDNFGSGINVGCSTCASPSDAITIRNTRVYGNQWHGIDVQNTTDVQVSNNLIYANGGAGLQALGSTKRSQLYNNSIANNSQIATSNAFGVYTANAATWIGRNNLITGHPLGPIFVGSLASQISCSNNLTDAASGSSLCSSWTLNAVPTNVWEDHDHATLANRDFRLKSGSAAIDNGVAGICTTATANANLCTPVLTLTGFVGPAPDQGAIESGFTAPPAEGQLIASYAFDTDFQDATTFNNDGTSTGATIVGGYALFDAAADRVTIPLSGASLSTGMTIALSARAVTLPGTATYLIGHTATAPSFSSRIQIKKNLTHQLVLGLGGSASVLTSSFRFALNATDVFDRIGLVLTPGSTAGTGNAQLWVNGTMIGTATYTGLNQLAGMTMGNNAGTQDEAWRGQLNNVRIWNYPRSAADMGADCAAFCGQPVPPDEDFILGSAEIGGAGDNVTTVQIESGADPARCTPLSNVQITYAGVDQTETACSITGTTNPIMRVTTAANALPGQVVTLTYLDQDPITVTNNVQGGGSFDPLVLVSCTGDITGLSIICTTQGTPNPTECQTLTKFIARDKCEPVTLNACSMTTGPGQRILTLRRVSPPADGTVAMDLIYVPSDQRLAVTNLFDPTDPEIPPTTGLAQTQWRCRPDGLNAATRWKGRPNQVCEAPSPGGVNIRLAIANTSGAPIPDFASSLFCSRQNVGGNYGSFQRISSQFGTLGLRYGPQTAHGVPDGVLLPSPALDDGGLTYVAIGAFRRQELQAARPTLGTNQQMEEEFALETGPTITALPIGTRFVCRAHDRVGNMLTSYTGLPGCISGAGPFTAGQIPCGAPLLIGSPTHRGR